MNMTYILVTNMISVTNMTSVLVAMTNVHIPMAMHVRPLTKQHCMMREGVCGAIAGGTTLSHQQWHHTPLPE